MKNSELVEALTNHSEKISEDVLAHDILVHQGNGGTAVEDVNGLAFGISQTLLCSKDFYKAYMLKLCT